MGISRKHLAENYVPVDFDPEHLASELRDKLPEVDFCFLMGSAVSGVVDAYSDLDLAFYVKEKVGFAFYGKVAEIVHELAPDVRADVGILNSSEPVYRYQALNGRLLFARDKEHYIDFFSRTCREYESQMFDYERQLRYRKEVANAL